LFRRSYVCVPREIETRVTARRRSVTTELRSLAQFSRHLSLILAASAAVFTAIINHWDGHCSSWAPVCCPRLRWLLAPRHERNSSSPAAGCEHSTKQSCGDQVKKKSPALRKRRCVRIAGSGTVCPRARTLSRRPALAVAWGAVKKELGRCLDAD